MLRITFKLLLLLIFHFQSQHASLHQAGTTPHPASHVMQLRSTTTIVALMERQRHQSSSQSVGLLSILQEALTNGTPVETSSPASVSSLVNRLQLDEEPEADVRDAYFSPETRDLFVTVDDPKKHVCTMETYITYRVSTKVAAAPRPPSQHKSEIRPLILVWCLSPADESDRVRPARVLRAAALPRL